MNTAIKSYIDSLIPQKLPEKKKQQLFDELEDHILERNAFYRDIGYTENESIEKAIDDFGANDDVKKSIYGRFEALYTYKKLKRVVSAVLLCVVVFLLAGAVLWGRYFIPSVVIGGNTKDYQRTPGSSNVSLTVMADLQSDYYTEKSKNAVRRLMKDNEEIVFLLRDEYEEHSVFNEVTVEGNTAFVKYEGTVKEDGVEREFLREYEYDFGSFVSVKLAE